jgi:hypothetical protein
MAFNLFGPLHLDQDLGRTLLDPLLPNGVTSAMTDVEWAPDRHAHLNDATSFDVVVHYSTATGRAAIAAIETKLTEPFSTKKYDTPRYREVASLSAVWTDPAAPDLASTTWNQICQKHLLVEALRHQTDADPNLLGSAIVVHHPDDTRARAATNAYRKFLAAPDRSFLVWTLDRIVELWRPIVVGSQHAQWLSNFADRYLNLHLSEPAWREAFESAEGVGPGPIATNGWHSSPPTPQATAAVEYAIAALTTAGISSVSPPELFTATNDAAWDLGYMLSSVDAWTAVYARMGYDYAAPPPDIAVIEL